MEKAEHTMKKRKYIKPGIEVVNVNTGKYIYPSVPVSQSGARVEQDMLLDNEKEFSGGKEEAADNSTLWDDGK